MSYQNNKDRVERAYLTVWNGDWESKGGVEITASVALNSPEEIKRIITRMVGLGATKHNNWVGDGKEGSFLYVTWKLSTCWLWYYLPYEVGR